MKIKYMLFALVFIGAGYNAEAQFLKKLKKKAEQAAERAVMRKTDQIVTQKTEKTIDDVAEGNSDKKKKEIDSTKTTNTPSSTTTTSRSPNVNPMMGSGKKVANIPNTYAFDYEFKTNMKITGKKKKDNADYIMNYFLNTNQEYYAMDIENEDIKKSGGKAIMVFDFKSESMVMLSSYNGQNMGMISKLKDPAQSKVKDSDRNYTYKEIGTKTILGYECYGAELENPDGKAILYFTLDAPVNFSAFFAFSGKAAPKGFSDPQLFDLLKEEALLMELEFISKKKDQTMKMIPISLEQKSNDFHKKDYQFMSMGL